MKAMKKVLFFFAFCLISNFIFSHEAGLDSLFEKEILHLNESNFNQVLKENKYVMIEFYAPWCTHCQKFMDDFFKVRNELTNDGILFAQVDCEEEKLFCRDIHVPAYPTLIFYSDYGESQYFFGEKRSSANLMEFIKKRVAGPDEVYMNLERQVLKLDESNFKQELAKHKYLTVFVSITETCIKCIDVYEFFAETVEDVGKLGSHTLAKLTISRDSNLMKEYQITNFPEILFFSNGKLQRYYRELIDQYNLAHWIHGHSREEYSNNPEIVDGIYYLNLDNFESVIEKNKYVFIYFFIPECQGCATMNPIFQEASKSPQLKERGVIFAKINSLVEPEIDNKMNNEQYPTLIFFNNGLKKEYSGKIDSEGIIKWLEIFASPTSIDLKTVEEVEKFIENSKTCTIHFGTQNVSDYLSAVLSYKYYSAGHCKTKECLDHYKVENGTTVLFKNFDEKRNDFPKNYTKSKFKEFILQKLVPKVLTYVPQNKEYVITHGVTSLVMFYNKETENGEKNYELIEKVAKELDKKEIKLQVMVSQLKSEEEKKLASQFNVNEDNLPSIVIVKLSHERLTKYSMEKEVNYENIIEFAEQWQENKLTQFILSEEIPNEKEANESNIKKIVAKNFNSVVNNKEKNVFVYFYIKEEKGELLDFFKLMSKKYSSFKDLLFTKLDISKNEIDYEFEEPLIGVWPIANKDEPIDYDFELNEEEFSKFLLKITENTYEIKESNEDL